jgi:RNA polymerase sigma-70 factor, ECF subfamily
VIDPLPFDAEPVPGEAPTTFEDLYRAHHRDVVRYAALMLGDPDEAADVAADTFSRAFDAWQDDRGPIGRSLPWLLVIARRLIVDRWRRRRLIRWLPLPFGSTLPAPDDGRRSEFWLWLDRLAAALPERQREVIFLRYRRDLTDAEIGAVMGLSESGVRSLAGRAIQSLRDHPELSQ